MTEEEEKKARRGGARDWRRRLSTGRTIGEGSQGTGRTPTRLEEEVATGTYMTMLAFNSYLCV